MENPLRPTPRPHIYPVIHYLDDATALRNAEVAFEAGCEGVFLIHMDGRDSLLEPAALAIKGRWPEKRVGINYLSLPAMEALKRNLRAGLDMTWTDDAGLNTLESTERAAELEAVLCAHPRHTFFGAAAFKYQAPEPDPAAAALRGLRHRMVPTTSGAATGVAADLAHIIRMSQAVDGRLAVASGITPDNVLTYAPYLSHILVATGVSADFYSLHPDKLRRLVQLRNGAERERAGLKEGKQEAGTAVAAAAPGDYVAGLCVDTRRPAGQAVL
jgi:hypothetical protein